MVNFRCNSQDEFNKYVGELELFTLATDGHERINFDTPEKLISTKGKDFWIIRVVKWIARFITCSSEHPAQQIAHKIIDFFETNKDFLLPEHNLGLAAISKIKPATGPDISARYLSLKQYVLGHEAHEKKVSPHFLSRINASIENANQTASGIIAQAKETESKKIANVKKIEAESNDYRVRVEKWGKDFIAEKQEQAEKDIQKLKSEASKEISAAKTKAEQEIQEIRKNGMKEFEEERQKIMTQLEQAKGNLLKLEETHKKTVLNQELESKSAKDKTTAEVAHIQADAKSKITELESEVKRLEAAKCNLLAKMHLVQETPVLIKCKDGEIPSVPYKYLFAETFFSAFLRWKENVKAVESFGKESGNGVQIAVTVANLSSDPISSDSKSAGEKDAKSTKSCVSTAVGQTAAKASGIALASLENSQGNVAASSSFSLIPMSLDPTEKQTSEERDALMLNRLDKEKPFIDLRDFPIITVRKFIELLEKQVEKQPLDLNGMTKEGVIELYSLAEYIIADVSHPIFKMCDDYFRNIKFLAEATNLRFLVSALVNERRVPIRKFLLNQIGVNLSLFRHVDELDLLNHTDLVKLLQLGGHTISVRRKVELLRRWFDKMASTESDQVKVKEILLKKIEGESLWDICFSGQDINNIVNQLKLNLSRIEAVNDARKSIKLPHSVQIELNKWTDSSMKVGHEMTVGDGKVNLFYYYRKDVGQLEVYFQDTKGRNIKFDVQLQHNKLYTYEHIVIGGLKKDLPPPNQSTSGIYFLQKNLAIARVVDDKVTMGFDIRL